MISPRKNTLAAGDSLGEKRSKEEGEEKSVIIY
jgi:hypothetical protein